MANIIHIGGSSDDARINDLGNTVEQTYLKKTDAESTYITKESVSSTNFAFVKSSSTPTNTNVFWIDTGKNNLLKYYDGTNWVPISAAWG